MRVSITPIMHVLAINLTIEIKVASSVNMILLKSLHNHSICQLPIHKIPVVYLDHLHLCGVAFVICRDATYLLLKCE